MQINLVTCTDWNYRRWAITLLNSLHDQYQTKYVIGVGEGDWDSFGSDLGVTVIKQPFNHAMDPVLWCQNVRMRHMRALIENVDYLLQVDADVRQNKFFDIQQFTKFDISAVTKQKGKGNSPIDPRFRINAGWVLYKNTTKVLEILAKIQQDFDNTYNNQTQWEQTILDKYFPVCNSVPYRFVDDGSKGGFMKDSTWYHCKGPGKKQNTDLDSWHNLSMTPKLT